MAAQSWDDRNDSLRRLVSTHTPCCSKLTHSISVLRSTMSTISAATAEHGEESSAALPLHSTAAPPHFTLYTYWRSSCSWRVRIALHYKQLTYTPQCINITKAEHKTEEYGRINPSHSVPALVVSYAETQQQLVMGQSLAILEWLEETHPSPPLLPTEPSQNTPS